jgi:hypothetical protein
MVVLVVRVIPNRLHPIALKHQVLVEANHIREAHNPQSMQRVLTMVVAMRQALVVVVQVLLVAIVLVVMVPYHRWAASVVSMVQPISVVVVAMVV